MLNQLARAECGAVPPAPTFCFNLHNDATQQNPA
jgi:hypothetical protein